jgi:hypothetical protein
MNKINEDCRVVFQKASSGWIDQHAPLITQDHYNDWIAGVKKGFPRLWSELASLRDINPNKKRQSNLIAGKERQVLHQIMTNFRQRNPKLLVWWSMVESVALMAWSVGTTAFDCLTYWGAHVSTKTRDRLLGSLFNAEQDKTVRDCLMAAPVLIYIIDNFQRGQRLKNQRGEHSGTFLSGTNQIAEQAFLYDNPLYNKKKPLEKLSYTVDETYPSPDGMAAYETYNNFAPADFFANHKEMPKMDPDFTGVRVKKYGELCDLASDLCSVKQYFVAEADFPKHFPDSFERSHVEKFRWDCRHPDATKLFTDAKDFERTAVLKWNESADDITPTIFIGLNALDEAASMETGAIVLDLLERAGVIVIEDDGGFALGDTDKFVLLFGNVESGVLQDGPANFLCHCTQAFREYVKEDLKSSDQWRVLCAVFLLLLSDFLAFVIAYRACDAILI